MIDGFENSKRVGRFAITPSRDIFGELTLSGANSSLYLHDKDEFSALTFPEDYIKGTLQDLTKVSLMGCIPLSWYRFGWPTGRKVSLRNSVPSFRRSRQFPSVGIVQRTQVHQSLARTETRGTALCMGCTAE